jgi:hypothetical protein
MTTEHTLANLQKSEIGGIGAHTTEVGQQNYSVMVLWAVPIKGLNVRSE